MPERKLNGLAQDVRLAREMGLTYGALNAPPVYVRGYAGELYPEICARRKADGKARYCPNCGRPVTGRKKYCDAVCGNAFRQKRYFERKKEAAQG